MALVTSKSTTWPRATAPTVESTGPSIAGCVFAVTARSSHAQPVIEWMRPPATLWEFGTFDTCSRRRADVTRRAPTPLTRTRKNACLTGLASTSSLALVPVFLAGVALFTSVSASTTPTGARGGGGQVQSARQAPGHRALAVPSHCSLGWLMALSPQTCAGVAVRDTGLWVIEGCALEAHPVVGQRLQEGDDVRPAIRLADEAADAVDGGVGVCSVGLVEIAAPRVELHHLVESEHGAVVHVGSAQLDVAEGRRLERAVDGEHVGRADRWQRILDGRDLRDAEPEEITPGEGERDTGGVRAAHAEILGGRPHADVEEAAVVEGVRPGRRLPLLDRLHAGAEVVRARRGERRARVALGALTAPFEGGEPVVLRRGQGGAPQLDAIEEAVVGDEGGLVELDRQPEEEREVLLHHRELAGGERRAGGSGDGAAARRERHDLVRVPPLGVEGRLDQRHIRLRQAARAGRRAALAERAEHAVGGIDALLRECREAQHQLADLVDRPAGG